MSQFVSPTDGLITKQTPVALPPTATDCLVNFDVNELGLLTKRSGTVLTPLSNAHKAYHVKTVGGVELVVCPYQTGLLVYTSSFTTLFSITNLYDDADSLLFTVVDVDTVEYFSVVLFANLCNPVQLFLHSTTFVLPANVTTVTLTLAEWNITRIFLFEGNSRLTVTMSKLGDDITFTVIPATRERTLTVITYGYGVWCNSQYYFGEELFRAVPRGDTTLDAVPSTLLTQLDSTNQAQIKAFVNSGVSYNYTAQPRFYNDVYFSDGQPYTYSVSDFLTYSPYFMTFGQPILLYTVDLSVEFVDVSANLFRIPGHGLREYMKIKFINEAPGGVALNTEYTVRNVTAETFKLESVTLTASISTNRPSYTVYASAIQADGRIWDGQTAGTRPISPYRLYSSALLPAGLVSGEKYYISQSSVGAPSGSYLSIYYDSSGEYPVFLTRFKTLQFDNSDVHTTADNVTINGHSWASGVPVALVNNGGTLPGGLSFGARYWIIVDDANHIGFSTTSDLSIRVDLTSAGSGTFTITESWGPWTFRPEYATGSFSVINTDSVLLLRARQLQLGKVASSLRVLVDSVLWARNTTATRTANTYYISDKDFNILAGSYDENAYIYFGATPEIGLSRTSFIQLLNVKAYSGMHSSFTFGSNYNNPFAINSVVTVYGYSDRFSEFSQPTAGAMAQNRLVLSNSNTVVLSNVADSFDRGQFYSNFGIDDRLTGEATQQFEISLSDTSYCVALVDYQNALIVFTKTSVYRLTGLTFNQYQTVKIAEHGVSSRKNVAELHSMLVYYNQYGVYALTIDVQEVYYASELSSTISNELRGLPTLLRFNRTKDLLYAVSLNKFLVLNTRSNKWSEYKFSWSQAITDSFVISGSVHLVDSLGVYYFSDVQYDLCTKAFNTGVQELAYANGSLYLDNILKLSATENTEVGGIPFCEDYYEVDTLIPEYTFNVNYRTLEITTAFDYRRTPVVFAVDDLAYNTLPEDAWTVVEYGYPIKAVYISSCVRGEQLSFNNRAIYAELVFSIEGHTDADIGLLHGSANKAEFVNSILSKVGYPGASTFVIVKEAFNGIAPVYRLVVRSKTQHKLSLSGFSLLEAAGSPMFNSGGL